MGRCQSSMGAAIPLALCSWLPWAGPIHANDPFPFSQAQVAVRLHGRYRNRLSRNIYVLCCCLRSRHTNGPVQHGTPRWDCTHRGSLFCMSFGDNCPMSPSWSVFPWACPAMCGQGRPMARRGSVRRQASTATWTPPPSMVTSRHHRMGRAGRRARSWSRDCRHCARRQRRARYCARPVHQAHDPGQYPAVSTGWGVLCGSSYGGLNSQTLPVALSCSAIPPSCRASCATGPIPATRCTRHSVFFVT